MTAMRENWLELLGAQLTMLSALVSDSVRALDREGARNLRYRLDGEFHSAVATYNLVMRCDLADGHSVKNIVEYDRVVPIRGKAWRQQRREAPRAAGGSSRKASHEGPGPRLAVDNTTRARSQSASLDNGGDHAA